MNASWLILPWNEWRRRPVRTGVTVMGVGLAVAALFSLVAFERGYRRGLQAELDRLGAHILVVPKGCPYDAASLALHGANWPCHLAATYLSEIRAVPGVKAAVPALMSALRDPAGQLVVYVGTDASLLGLRPQWRIRGRFPERGAEMLAGSELAHRYGWRVGDTVRLPGLTDVSATVCGLLEVTHGAEDYFIHLPLAEAQRQFQRPNELTHVLVRLADPTRLDEVVRQLHGCGAGMDLNVVPLTHLFRTFQQLINSTRSLLACIVVVAGLVSGVGVANALLMAIGERTREIGVFRALGASRADIVRVVLTEAIMVCLAGAGVGIALALAGARSLEVWLRARLPLVPAGGFAAWDSYACGACLLGAVALGALAACVPAWRACEVPPQAAMRGLGGGW